MHSQIVTLDCKHQVMVNDDEPDYCIKRLEGHVVEELGYRRARIGRFRVFVVDLDLALCERRGAFDVFDSLSQTADYWDLYTSTGDLRAKVVKVLPGGHRGGANMLILDRLELHPKHRGRGVGLEVLRCLMQQYGLGCDVVAMKPFPLQFEGWLTISFGGKPEIKRTSSPEEDREFRRATAKLREHYGRLGFVRVPGTDFMVADPYTVLPQLTPEG